MALRGFNFNFHSLSNSEKTPLVKLITENGGSVSYIFGKNVTHLVTTSQAIQENGYKIQRCKLDNIRPITEKWLRSTIKNYKPEQKKEKQKENNKQKEKKYEEKQLQLAFTPASNNTEPPSISMILPNSGINTGNFTLAIFGINFEPNSNFKVRITNNSQIVLSSKVEFHSTTSIIAYFDKFLLPAGEFNVEASNNGTQYGIGSNFNIYDPLSSPQLFVQNSSEGVDRQIHIIRSQLENVRRTVLHVQQVELDLSNKLNFIASGKTLPYGDHQLFKSDEINQKINNISNKLINNEEDIEENTTQDLYLQNQLLEREIRLFISSPFVDMQKERDLFVKIAVPQIRRICIERDIIFNYVDLRWGITDAQTSQSTMIIMCLRELQKSNMFVGCLGERYGYSIPKSDISLSSNDEQERKQSFQRAFKLAEKEFPWISEYADRSVTELEMAAILRDEDNRMDSSWFYLRDPYYIEEIPENERKLYRSENEESLQKLEQLKEDIEQSSILCNTYKRPSQFTDLLTEEILAYIDKKYPQDYVMSDIERERFRHQVYSRSLSIVYLPNEEQFIKIDKYVMGNYDRPLVISGPTGIGKSALLANWAKRHEIHHPEDIVICHWVTCSPLASNHVNMIFRIMNEILEAIQHYDKTVIDSLSYIKYLSIENERKRILDEFPVWIDKLFRNDKIKNRIILILDGLDNIEDDDNALDFTWFPRSFPNKLRVITSTTDNNGIHKNLTLKLLRKRNSQEEKLEELNLGQRKSFIIQYLQNKHGKKLNEQQELRIAESPQTGNPRFLETLLDEICISAVHDNLDSLINKFLQAKNAISLYEIVLSRIDNDYDSSHKGFIKRIFCLIALSHNGLHCTDELARILRDSKNNVQISEEEFSTLYLMIGTLISTAGGLLTFTNEDIETAVKNLYLKDISTQIEYHKELANHFTGTMQDNITNNRVLSELPFHLEKSEQFEKLSEFLSNINVVDKMCTDTYKSQFEQYWRALEVMGKNIEVEYAKMIRLAQFPPSIVRADLLYKIANFFTDMTKYSGAEKMYLLARTHYENSSSTLNLAKVDYALGNLYCLIRKFNQGITCLKRSLSCYEKEGGESIEQGMAMERLGTAYMNMNKLTEAKSILTPALEFCERRFGTENNTTADIIYDLGCITFAEAKSGCGGVDQQKAEQWLRKALDIKAILLGDWHPEVARVLNRLASIYIEQNQFNDAEACYEQALLIRQEKLGKHHTRVLQTLKHMISCFEMQEKNEEAIEACVKAREITDIRFGKSSDESQAISIRMGILYWLINKKKEGIVLLEQVKDAREKQYGKDHEKVKQVTDTIADLTASSIPPPPPPPQFTPPPPQIPKPKPKPTIQLKLGSGGIPLPPPPPCKPCKPIQQKATNTPLDLLQDIQKVGLKQQQVKHDRSDAKVQALRMMGKEKRKIRLKQLKK